MLEILKSLFAWMEREGGGLLCGFVLGALVVLAARLRQRKEDRCYQREWIESYRQESRLAKMILNENQKYAAQLIEEDRRKYPPEK